ncbi:MAG: hypothetical protein LBD41_03525 [Clostridiales Family XIII bacterium]|jgi:hypothetical protein|nr:hypothetical protein [Clostridiales Family XIII bacterium]
MPTEQRSSEWSKLVKGHKDYDFKRIVESSIDSNSHFVVISFPGFPDSKTFAIADLDWIQSREAGETGTFNSKESEWFIFGETRKILNNEVLPITGTIWDSAIEQLRVEVDAHMNFLGTTYFVARSILI